MDSSTGKLLPYTRSETNHPALLQSDKHMINSNSQTVFLIPRVSELWQTQDLAWALLGLQGDQPPRLLPWAKPP